MAKLLSRTVVHIYRSEKGKEMAKRKRPAVRRWGGW